MTLSDFINLRFMPPYRAGAIGVILSLNTLAGMLAPDIDTGFCIWPMHCHEEVKPEKEKGALATIASFLWSWAGKHQTMQAYRPSFLFS